MKYRTRSWFAKAEVADDLRNETLSSNSSSAKHVKARSAGGRVEHTLERPRSEQTCRKPNSCAKYVRSINFRSQEKAPATKDKDGGRRQVTSAVEVYRKEVSRTVIEGLWEEEWMQAQEFRRGGGQRKFGGRTCGKSQMKVTNSFTIQVRKELVEALGRY